MCSGKWKVVKTIPSFTLSVTSTFRALKVEVTDKVKEGIVFTTFHFPEHMVNMVTGHGKDEETMCAEYKVSSVQVQKISNQFKTEVKPKEHQAEVS